MYTAILLHSMINVQLKTSAIETCFCGQCITARVVQSQIFYKQNDV